MQYRTNLYTAYLIFVKENEEKIYENLYMPKRKNNIVHVIL